MKFECRNLILRNAPENAADVTWSLVGGSVWFLKDPLSPRNCKGDPFRKGGRVFKKKENWKPNHVISEEAHNRKVRCFDQVFDSVWMYLDVSAPETKHNVRTYDIKIFLRSNDIYSFKCKGRKGFYE